MGAEKVAERGELSPWWRWGVLFIMLAEFAVLFWLAGSSYSVGPPIPERVVGPDGQTVFTGDDIMAGQQVFLKHGLMDNGSFWGHGAYLGPDFAAAYLHRLAVDVRGDAPASELDTAKVRSLLTENRYDPSTHVLRFTRAEADSYHEQVGYWTGYFSDPDANRGLRAKAVGDPTELRELTAFFAWGAWASVAHIPGRDYSYTNNFPYDPAVGNGPSVDAIIWSALSLVALLGGTAAILFAFGRFDFLGWREEGDRELQPRLVPGEASPAQRATLKLFLLVPLLFLAQTLVGGALAHYRADPSSFYGIDISPWLPSNLLRTWHLQLAIFWIATAYVGGGLFLAVAVGEEEPRGQVALTQRPVRRAGRRRLRQPARRAGRDAGLAQGALVLAGRPGLGVPGARPRLAVPAGGRLRALGRHACAGGAAGAEGARGARDVEALPGRRLRHPALLPAGALLRPHQHLHRRGHLALLDHPPLGGGLLRAVRDRHGGHDVLPAWAWSRGRRPRA